MREQMRGREDYQLDGELDKAGHPLLHEHVGSVKPDYLVHQHGEMNKNIAVVEVKPINASRGGISKDVDTLCRFLKFADYYRAIYLIYGREGEFNVFLDVVKAEVSGVPANSFYVMWHKQVGIPASPVWSNR